MTSVNMSLRGLISLLASLFNIFSHSSLEVPGCLPSGLLEFGTLSIIVYQ